MTPWSAPNVADESSSKKPVRLEVNSLLHLMVQGQRHSIRQKVGNSGSIVRAYRYPPMGTSLQYRHVRTAERKKGKPLDTTFHITSYLAHDSFSVPTGDVAICAQYRHVCSPEQNRRNPLDTTFHITSYLENDTSSIPTDKSVLDGNTSITREFENKLYMAYDDITIKFLDTFKQSSYTSIEMSNMKLLSEAAETVNLSGMLCSIISSNGFILESLCLHNCHIDDSCCKHLASLITSKSNKLKCLNLSKNKITDIGVEALLAAVKSKYCMVEEFDLSQNRLSLSGITSFAEELSTFPRCKVLRLADSEQLIPLTIYQKFADSIERHIVIHTLTLGMEEMEGSHAEHCKSVELKDNKEFDELLCSLWHEPSYTSVTDYIRALLRLNFCGMCELMQVSTNQKRAIDLLSIRRMIDNVKPEMQLNACYRILRLKPDMLVPMANN
jgi:Leucine Rich repeat